jgi:hypothetical protein
VGVSLPSGTNGAKLSAKCDGHYFERRQSVDDQ